MGDNDSTVLSLVLHITDIIQSKGFAHISRCVCSQSHHADTYTGQPPLLVQSVCGGVVRHSNDLFIHFNKMICLFMCSREREKDVIQYILFS